MGGLRGRFEQVVDADEFTHVGVGQRGRTAFIIANTVDAALSHPSPFTPQTCPIPGGARQPANNESVIGQCAPRRLSRPYTVSLDFAIFGCVSISTPEVQSWLASHPDQ